MNEYSVVDEQEIDLIDFLKSMLEQWKGLLFVGILCMFLLPGLKYVKDELKDSSAGIISGTDMNDNTSMEKIIASTNPGVALNYYVTWQQFTDTYEDSLLMKLDASNIRRLTLKYFIKSTDGGTDYIASYYSNLSTDEKFIGLIAKTMDVESVDLGYVADLLSVSSSGSMMNDGGNLKVTIILLDGVSEESVLNAVSEYLTTLAAENSNIMGEHNISLLSSGVVVSFDEDIIKLQGNAVSNIYNWKNSFFNIFKGLSDDEKIEVENVIECLSNGELDYQDVKEKYPAQTETEQLDDSTLNDQSDYPASNREAGSSRLFNRKYALLGFVLGLFLYVGCALAIQILIRRYRNGEEAANSLRLRSYGDIYEYPYHGFLAFIHDKNVYTWRHKKKSGVEDIAKAICAKAKFGSTTKITCLVLGNANEVGMNRIDEIVKHVTSFGIEIKTKMTPDGVSSLSEEEIGKFSPILLTIISGQTRPAQALELIMRLKEYNIQIFGMNFIEG